MATALTVNAESLIQPDSQGFLEFSPLRTALYPLILRIVASTSGSALNTIYLQIGMAGVAALFLAFSVCRWSGRWWHAYAVLIAVLANPSAVALHAQILSDSLFVSTLCLFLGVLLRMDREPALRHYFSVSLLTGIAIALRPASYAILPLWLFILWLYPVGRTRGELAAALILITAPGVLIVSSERLYHGRVHGPEAASLLDIHLFARAVAMDDAWPAAAAAVDPVLRQAITAFRADTDVISARIASVFDRRYYLMEREVEAQYRFPPGPLLGVAGGLGLPVHRYQRRFGLATIVANPLPYVQLAASHYAMSWVLFTDDGALSFHKRIVRFGVISIGVATLTLAIAGFFLVARRAMPHWLRVPWLSSLLLHGSFLLIGLVGVYGSRYTSGYWPAMVIAVLLPVLNLVRPAARLRQGANESTTSV